MIKLANILKEIEQPQYIIYCDMDGVLVDFDKGYKDLTGMTPKEAELKLGQDGFWKPLDQAGVKFWLYLKWMPDGKALWQYIRPYKPLLLSAPSRQESSKIGKRMWVKREVLGGAKLILKAAKYKQEYATPNSILIDDRLDNIERWNAAGGIGIHHTSAADTITQLKQLGL